MRKIVAMLLIAVLTAQSTNAATIYLRDKTRIENVQIISEAADAFHVQKAGKNYSFAYMPAYDVVNKSDVFCIMNEKGEIEYPAELRMGPIPTAGGGKELSPQEFQAVMLQEEANLRKEQASAFKGISGALLVCALAAVSSSIALWCLYGQTK
jgi:hypothetical protein